MSAHVLDIRPGGIVETLHDGNILAVSQDVTDILASCEAERAENDKLKGFRKIEAFRHVASIPLALVEVIKGECGMDILNDPEALFKFLNDSRYAAFRTASGRV